MPSLTTPSCSSATDQRELLPETSSSKVAATSPRSLANTDASSATCRHTSPLPTASFPVTRFTDHSTGMQQLNSSAGSTTVPKFEQLTPQSTNSKLPPGFTEKHIPVSVSVPAESAHSTASKKPSKPCKKVLPSLVKPVSHPVPVKREKVVSSSSPSNAQSRETVRESVVQLQRKDSIDHLHRKDSNESIRSNESSDLASTPSSSGSGVEETQLADNQKKLVMVEIEVKPSYTKEPLTGQTVPVIEESEIAKIKDESSDAATVPLSIALSVPKPRSKKKQRAQLKREEKLKRRQRERDELQALKKVQATHDSNADDKMSITSSSASSTDFTEEEVTVAQELKQANREEEEEEEEEPEVDELSLSQQQRSQEQAPQEEADVKPVQQDLPVSCEDKQLESSDEFTSNSQPCVEMTKQALSVDTISQMEADEDAAKQEAQEEEEEDAVLQHKTKSPRRPIKEPHSSPRRPPSSPRPKKTQLSPRSAPERSSSAPTGNSSKLSSASVASPVKVKPEQFNSSAIVEGVKEVEDKPVRPNNLALAQPNQRSERKSVPLSADTDGPELAKPHKKSGEDNAGGAGPHEIASSLLSKLQRNKHKEKPSDSHGNEGQGRQKHTGRKERAMVEQHSTTLSLDAQPFIPAHYPPQQHYPAHLMAHNYPVPRHTLHRGHRLASPPFEYYPGPGVMFCEDVNQERFDHRRHRKRDHLKHPVKVYAPSPAVQYLREGGHYPERPFMVRGMGGVYGAPAYDPRLESHEDEELYQMRQLSRSARRLASLRMAQDHQWPSTHHSEGSDPSWDQMAAFGESDRKAKRERIQQQMLLLQAQQDELDSEPHEQLYDQRRQPSSRYNTLQEPHRHEGSVGRSPFNVDDDNLFSETALIHRLQQHESSLVNSRSSSSATSTATLSLAPGSSRTATASKLLSSPAQPPSLADLFGETSNSEILDTSEVRLNTLSLSLSF